MTLAFPFFSNLKGLLHLACIARDVSWLAFVVRRQRPTKRRHVQGMLDETDPFKLTLKLPSSGQKLLLLGRKGSWEVPFASCLHVSFDMVLDKTTSNLCI